MEGIKTTPSDFGPAETMDRLERAVTAKGMHVFARIDHAAGAAAVALTLRPTELLVFGNARAGTPLMLQSQLIGIDLPLKALVWQDASGQTWLSYREPHWLAEQYGIAASTAPVTAAMTQALSSLVEAATSHGAEP